MWAPWRRRTNQRRPHGTLALEILCQSCPIIVERLYIVIIINIHIYIWERTRIGSVGSSQPIGFAYNSSPLNCACAVVAATHIAILLYSSTFVNALNFNELAAYQANNSTKEFKGSIYIYIYIYI